MKIILNVNRELFGGMGDGWIECQGARFVEGDDGSFDLHFTSDIASSCESDASLAAAIASVRGEPDE